MSARAPWRTSASVASASRSAVFAGKDRSRTYPSRVRRATIMRERSEGAAICCLTTVKRITPSTGRRTVRWTSVPRSPLMSASAAEILASALGDHRRAVVVGERTYGKTSVQSVLRLENGGALRLTTGTYRTPAGDDIGDAGVAPDVAADDDPLTRPDEAVLAGERVLLHKLPTAAVQRPR